MFYIQVVVDALCSFSLRPSLLFLPKRFFILLGKVFTEVTFMRHVTLVRDTIGSVEGIYLPIFDDVS